MKKFNTDGVLGLIVMSVTIKFGRHSEQRGDFIQYKSGIRTGDMGRIKYKKRSLSVGRYWITLSIK